MRDIVQNNSHLHSLGLWKTASVCFFFNVDLRLILYLNVYWIECKNRNPFIFLVNSIWFLVVCSKLQSLLGCLGFNYLCVRCGYHTTASREPCGLISRVLQKLLIIIIINHYFLSFPRLSHIHTQAIHTSV